MIQKLVNIGTNLLFLLGIFWVIFSSVIFSQYMEMSEYFSFFSGALLIGIFFGIALIIWALLGMIAICKKLNYLLIAYNLGMFVFFLLQVAILILSIFAASSINSYKNDTSCTKQSFLIELAELNAVSYQTLCQNDCQCHFEGNKAQAQNLGIKNYINNELYPQKIQECQAFNFFDLQDKDENSNFLQALEETFYCSGFCSINSYYVFSNVNDGIPNKDCKQEALEFFEKNNNITLICSSIVTFLMALSFIFSVLWCFQKPQLNYGYQKENSIRKNVEMQYINTQ
ncbi:tetraspanin family protein (macronuclear) [Tetrahymena thermophila SB210]|uniref:Tetraspanin family protein n=1 Tax=Tetrahymena thermophila (strain SB210) TaxID=312017 RepID=Q24FE5_TETTS|nr:tetraspanin family protein [Tetrahymena thermophila SB210]EAS06513.1 tetraspanin family protein [Tetrahymena thermophila SB210]|eukprot:XP_001026758.1 tetraspanin family protein [Tetrahymena thermophila SB210]